MMVPKIKGVSILCWRWKNNIFERVRVREQEKEREGVIRGELVIDKANEQRIIV